MLLTLRIEIWHLRVRVAAPSNHVKVVLLTGKLDAEGFENEEKPVQEDLSGASFDRKC